MEARGKRPQVEKPMRRMSLLILVTTLLAAAPASPVEQALGFLSSLWTAVSADWGCSSDPNGRCEPAPAPDSGCSIDPYGKPVCAQGS